MEEPPEDNGAGYLDSYYYTLGNKHRSEQDVEFNHVDKHNQITTFLKNTYNYDDKNLAVAASGANGVIFKIENAKVNSEKKTIYMKVAHAINKKFNTEIFADSMVLESITSKQLSSKYPVVAGIDHAWQLPKDKVKALLAGLQRPVTDYNLYNTALILHPSINSTTLNNCILQLEQKYSTKKAVIELLTQDPFFINFLINTLKLGYETGFVHNDLHGGNVLVILDGQTGGAVIGFKIIDLGRAYCTLAGTDNNTIYRNEYAKLVNKTDMTTNETFNSFKRRVPLNTSLADCIKRVVPAYIKTRQTDDFQKKTYILFDLIGLLNGIKYFDENFTSKQDSRDWLIQSPPSIYNLLCYWYQEYTTVCKQKGISPFYEYFWIYTPDFLAIKDDFYKTIMSNQTEINSLIEKLIGSSSGGSSSSKRRSKPKSSLSGIVSTPFGESLMGAMDGRPRAIAKPTLPSSQRIATPLLFHLPPAIPVYGGKKQKSPSNNPKPDGPSRLDPRHNKNQTSKPTSKPTPDPSAKQTKTPPKQPPQPPQPLPNPHQSPRKRPPHRPHPRSASPETTPTPISRRKTKTHQSQNR